jgi:hypothetical protein
MDQVWQCCIALEMTADNLPPVALNYAVECLLAESLLKHAMGGFNLVLKGYDLLAVEVPASLVHEAEIQPRTRRCLH